MNFTKNLTTAAAAVALAGVIGIAYAQTTNGTAQSPSTDTGQMSSPGATTPSTSDSTAAPAAATPMQSGATDSGATSGATDSATMPTERAPKADRG